MIARMFGCCLEPAGMATLLVAAADAQVRFCGSAAHRPTFLPASEDAGYRGPRAGEDLQASSTREGGGHKEGDSREAGRRLAIGPWSSRPARLRILWGTLPGSIPGVRTQRPGPPDGRPFFAECDEAASER